MLNLMLMSLVLLYCLISIVYTLQIKFKNILIKKSDKKNKRSNKEAMGIGTHLIIDILEILSFLLNNKTLHNFFYIKKRRVEIIICLSAASVFFISNAIIKDWDKIPSILIYTLFVPMVLIIFYGVARILSLQYKFMYAIHLVILLTYTLIFSLSNFEDLPTNPLVFTLSIGIPMIYSFVFLKNIISTWANLLFIFSNIIMIFLFVLINTGLVFGVHYLKYQDIYNFYSESDYTLLSKGVEMSHLPFMIQVGLNPFYSYSPPEFKVDISTGYISLVPFSEFILGTVFNLFFISFLISYLVAKFSKDEEGEKKLKEKHTKKNFST